MKIENLDTAKRLADKINSIDDLLSGKQLNLWLNVSNKDGDLFTFDEEHSKEVQAILKKSRDKLIVAYSKLDRE